MAKRKLENFDDYNRALKNKYGVGEGQNYKPWLRVQDVQSDKSVRSQTKGIKSKRVHHTLSSIETDFFYLAEFSDSVVDIREQFPLIPINLSLKIAKSLNIEHPIHPNSRDPVVITTDFLLTRKIDASTIYEAYTVKPDTESKKERVLEKLEIERVWWELLGIEFNYFMGNANTQIESSNIRWSTHGIRNELNSFSDDVLFAAIDLIKVGRVLKSDICNNFARSLNIEHEHALELFRYLIGMKLITVDLSQRLEHSDIVDIIYKRNFSMGGAVGNS